MNEDTIKLVALGASAAVNCRPCLEHHMTEARRLGLTEEDIAAAIEVGMGVNQGAARQTQQFVKSLLGQGEAAVLTAPAGQGGGRCC